MGHLITYVLLYELYTIKIIILCVLSSCSVDVHKIYVHLQNKTRLVFVKSNMLLFNNNIFDFTNT